MNLTISELHFAIRTLVARVEWLNDEDDDSEEEGEKENLQNLIKKLNGFSLEIHK
jgi:hypothetical protein